MEINESLITWTEERVVKNGLLEGVLLSTFVVLELGAIRSEHLLRSIRWAPCAEPIVHWVLCSALLAPDTVLIVCERPTVC